MHPRSLILFAALAVPAALSAQKETGGFLVRLGTDTLAIESFTRVGGRLEGRFASRVGQFTEWQYLARLGPDGTVQDFEMHVVRATAPNPVPRRAVAFGRDSAIVTLLRGDSTRTVRFATPTPAFPFLNHSMALYELVARRARAGGGDPVTTTMLSPTADKAWATSVTKQGADSLVVALENGIGVRLKVDARGKVLGASGHGTTQQVDVERNDRLAFQTLADAFASRPLVGPLSVRDTTRATIGDANLWIDYGRPLKRGREIFGALEPWNRVWRTGANAATQLNTSADLIIGGATVPAGIYTVWTLPSPAGWKLIINKQHGQWGTDYHADSDFVRVDMKLETLAQPIEQFTIAVDPQGDGAVLRMEWDRTRVTVPVAKKP